MRFGQRRILVRGKVDQPGGGCAISVRFLINSNTGDIDDEGQ